MSIHIWRDISEFWENMANMAIGTLNSTSYFYGVCFKSSQNCSLKAVKFLGTTFTGGGTLKIAKGNYASASGTTYNVSASSIVNGEYTLSTAFNLTANTNYTISFKINTTGTFGYNNQMAYPVVGNILTFNYGTYSGSDTQLTANGYVFKALKISI